MIVHDVEQGSEAWERTRWGKATASRFGEFIKESDGTLKKVTPKKTRMLIDEVRAIEGSVAPELRDSAQRLLIDAVHALPEKTPQEIRRGLRARRGIP